MQIKIPLSSYPYEQRQTLRKRGMTRFFYLTRWALRNDPALGYMMFFALAYSLEFHAMYRDVRQRIAVAVVEAILTHPTP